MVPQLEEVGPDIGQWAGVLPHNVQILLRQLPHGRASALEQGRVVQVALCGGKRLGISHGAHGWKQPGKCGLSAPIGRAVRAMKCPLNSGDR